MEDNESILQIEKPLLKTAGYTIFFLALIEIIAYYGFFRNIDGFFSKFGYYLIFLVFSIAVNSLIIWHIKAYGHDYDHMNGMMIGMTIGMTSGFSIGMIIGATNGMFIGSLAGLIIGMAAGGYIGNCCGIMGVMEGLMAGLMGGLMGAMTSVMTLNDNLKLLVPVVMLSLFAILAGLFYMVSDNESRREKKHYSGFELLPFLTINFITLVALTFLMVYGPKSFLFA